MTGKLLCHNHVHKTAANRIAGGLTEVVGQDGVTAAS